MLGPLPDHSLTIATPTQPLVLRVNVVAVPASRDEYDLIEFAELQLTSYSLLCCFATYFVTSPAPGHRSHTN
jgi:hypothetical protein